MKDHILVYVISVTALEPSPLAIDDVLMPSVATLFASTGRLFAQSFETRAVLSRTYEWFIPTRS